VQLNAVFTASSGTMVDANRCVPDAAEGGILTPAKWDQLYVAAERLFLESGFHATGIGEILSESGLVRQTLYNHFTSKEALVAAVVERYGEQWREWFFGLVEDRASRPTRLVPVLFEVLADWFESEDFRGCLCRRALTEFPEAGHPAHGAAVAHMECVRAQLERCATRAARVPKQKAAVFAGELELLMGGAITQAAHSDGVTAAKRARKIASRLLKEYGPE